MESSFCTFTYDRCEMAWFQHWIRRFVICSRVLIHFSEGGGSTNFRFYWVVRAPGKCWGVTHIFLVRSSKYKHRAALCYLRLIDVTLCWIAIVSLQNRWSESCLIRWLIPLSLVEQEQKIKMFLEGICGEREFVMSIYTGDQFRWFMIPSLRWWAFIFANLFL